MNSSHETRHIESDDQAPGPPRHRQTDDGCHNASSKHSALRPGRGGGVFEAEDDHSIGAVLLSYFGALQ
jgi:hypothetical protein